MKPARNGICDGCTTSYSRAWLVGERTDTLQGIIDALKFERVMDAADSLASLLDMRLPVLPESVIVVPVPTSSSHIRQRGYDHSQLIAKKFAKSRGLKMEQPLRRVALTVQRGKSKKERFEQASMTYHADRMVDSSSTYLLLDDVVTTNATFRYCAAALMDAGAQDVWVAAIARQPLDK